MNEQNEFMTVAERDAVIHNAFARGDNPVVAVQEYEKKFKSKHGGARPGAGRKPGKWPFAKGRNKTTSVNCYLRVETKAELDRQSKNRGMNHTEYIEWLIEQNK